MKTIDFYRACEINESGLSIEPGCVVACHRNGSVIVAVSDSPDHSIDSCQAKLVQFCEEYGEGLDGPLCSPDDFEFCRVE